MKNLLNISALLCAVALTTSCSNEEIVENGTAVDGFTLVATTGANTKTSVDENYNVNWTTADAFYVFGDKTADKVYSSKGTFTLKNGTSTTGTFKGTVTGTMSKLQYAVYPSSTYTPKDMKITFPAEYTYPNSNAPMFGKLSADKKTVVFDQLLSGMMRIKINGLGQASGSLTLKGTGIAGSATLTIGTDDKAALSDLSDKADAITLKFNNSGDADPLILDIPVPAGTYSAGLAAELAIDGTSNPAEVFKTAADFVVNATKLKEMPDITIAEINSSTISFTKEVENVNDAKKALEAGSKNVTIKAVNQSDAVEIPSTSTADAPATINISGVTTNDFTVKGAQGGSTEAVKINMPEGSSGTVTVENIEHVEISGGWTVTTNQIGDNENKVLVIAAGNGVKELTVKEIEHVEISGSWEKVNSSTGENTLVVKGGAVVKELAVKQGNIEIETGAVVNKLTLDADVTINNALDISVGQKMEVILGTHTLTFGGNFYTRILGSGELTLTGDASAKGKVVDKTQGIALVADAAKFAMTNVEYSGTHTDAVGILMDKYVSNAAVKIENSTMASKYYCINTNASAPVGSGNTITLKNSTFTAAETALMVNNSATLTATDCTFTGGWQGAFLRGGTFLFNKCGFNLNITSYGTSSKKAGDSWGDGNNARSAAITTGNRSTGSSYDYKTTLTLENSCTFSVATVDGKTYPSIYIDAEASKDNQGVTFKYDDASAESFNAAGTGLDIQEKTGKVTVNGTPYTRTTADE